MVKQNVLYAHSGSDLLGKLSRNGLRFPRRTVIAVILLVALMAFELFNFDTTRYALTSLLGPVSFLGIGWASILAIAFCAIDFAGLVRLFTPEAGGEQPKEVWYLMGAWLLGATMNALMTWWAVSLTLLNHDFGNEVLSRGQLLQIVPIFVATLVWLTRILFIGALTVTGSHLLFSSSEEAKSRGGSKDMPLPTGKPLRENGTRGRITGGMALDRDRGQRQLPHMTDELPEFLARRDQAAETATKRGNSVLRTDEAPDNRETLDGQQTKVTMRSTVEAEREERHQRVRQRPPIPGANGHSSR